MPKGRCRKPVSQRGPGARRIVRLGSGRSAGRPNVQHLKVPPNRVRWSDEARRASTCASSSWRAIGRFAQTRRFDACQHRFPRRNEGPSIPPMEPEDTNPTDADVKIAEFDALWRRLSEECIGLQWNVDRAKAGRRWCCGRWSKRGMRFGSATPRLHCGSSKPHSVTSRLIGLVESGRLINSRTKIGIIGGRWRHQRAISATNMRQFRDDG